MSRIEWEEHREDCCVVIPVYKSSIVFFEQAALMQCVRVLGKKRDIYLVAPYDLDLTPYTSVCPEYKFKVKRLAKEFFAGFSGYNQMCKRWEFYDLFKEYWYMLIYQLDCWVFDDNLDYFTSLDLDYIGAPWITIDTEKNTAALSKCGNGGFSLRKIDKFVEVCKKHNDEADKDEVAEDVFFSNNCADELKISSVDIGREFSFEVGPSLLFKLNKEMLPMGCHKPYLFEFKTFWKDYIKF
jgi:hypothetical protein